MCTTDGSSGLTGIEHVERFFADPSAHCVGYGARMTKSMAAPPAATSSPAAAATATKSDAPDNTKVDGDVIHPDTAGAAAVTAAALEFSPSKVAAGEGPAIIGEAERASTCPALLVRERERERVSWIVYIFSERDWEGENVFRRGGDEEQSKPSKCSHTLTGVFLDPHPR